MSPVFYSGNETGTDACHIFFIKLQLHVAYIVTVKAM